MRRLATLSYLVFVLCLVAQALSLALHPQTAASTPAVLSPKAHYGSYEPGSEPNASITATATFRAFLRHGIDKALGFQGIALPNHSGNADKPMSRNAWQASPYFRAGLHFGHWSRAISAWEARRYDAILDRRFDAAWHPVVAFWGYWLGRLLFLWVGLSILGVMTMVYILRRTYAARS